jgi:hypothetical protein
MRELAVEVEHLDTGWIIYIPELGLSASGLAQDSISHGAAHLTTRVPDRIASEVVCVVAAPVGDGVSVQTYTRSDFGESGSTWLETAAALFKSLPNGSALVPILR